MKLPTDFIESVKPLLNNEWDSFIHSLEGAQPVSIRLNRLKHTDHWADHFQTMPIPWCRTGYYLDKRPLFTFDPLFHAGVYYVQEASSMFIEQVFKTYFSDKENITALDLCAAPGGKSSHLISLLSEDSLLVSNEVIRSRANILSENMTKTGYPNHIVINSDPSEIGKLTHLFDLILIDAPCSGEGMFRKNPEATKEWSAANVKLCKERQQRIVADSWNALKPGGILIYSTCTYNRFENEENIHWIKDHFGATVLPIKTKEDWNIAPSYDTDLPVYHFFPHRTKGEGFFIATLRKKTSDMLHEFSKKTKNKKDNVRKQKEADATIKNLVLKPELFTFFEKGNAWFAFPTKHYEAFLEVCSHTRLVSAGICIGEIKGKNLIPQHSLALSISINRQAFNTLEVDTEKALSYLRKEALILPTDLPAGYILLTYQNIPLGFIKNIGNRANNLYPNEWRIRSVRKPE